MNAFKWTLLSCAAWQAGQVVGLEGTELYRRSTLDMGSVCVEDTPGAYKIVRIADGEVQARSLPRVILRTHSETIFSGLDYGQIGLNATAGVQFTFNRAGGYCASSNMIPLGWVNETRAPYKGPTAQPDTGRIYDEKPYPVALSNTVHGHIFSR